MAEGPGTPRGRGASGGNPRTSRGARSTSGTAGRGKTASRGAPQGGRTGASQDRRSGTGQDRRAGAGQDRRGGAPQNRRTVTAEDRRAGAAQNRRAGAAQDRQRWRRPGPACEFCPGPPFRCRRPRYPPCGSRSGRRQQARGTAAPEWFFSVGLASIQQDPKGCRRRRIPRGQLGAWRTPRPGRAPGCAATAGRRTQVRRCQRRFSLDRPCQRGRRVPRVGQDPVRVPAWAARSGRRRASRYPDRERPALGRRW